MVIFLQEFQSNRNQSHVLWFWGRTCWHQVRVSDLYVRPECGHLGHLSKEPAWSLVFLSWQCACLKEAAATEERVCISSPCPVQGWLVWRSTVLFRFWGVQPFLLLWGGWGACGTWNLVCWVWAIVWCCWRVLLGSWALFYWTAVNFMWNPGISIWARGKTHTNLCKDNSRLSQLFIILSSSSVMHIHL